MLNLLFNVLILIAAILAEVVGDASIRVGIRSRILWRFGLGALLVVCYGTLMNFPSWSFGRTFGVYITLLFIVSQVVAVVMLKEHVPLPTIVGGAFIVCGGLVILLWRPT